MNLNDPKARALMEMLEKFAEDSNKEDPTPLKTMKAAPGIKAMSNKYQKSLNDHENKMKDILIKQLDIAKKACIKIQKEFVQKVHKPYWKEIERKMGLPDSKEYSYGYDRKTDEINIYENNKD